MSDKDLPPGFDFVFDSACFGGRRRIAVPLSVKKEIDAEEAQKAFEEAVRDVEASEKDGESEALTAFGMARKKLDERTSSEPSTQIRWAEIELADLLLSYGKDHVPIFKTSQALKLNKTTGDNDDTNRLQQIHDELLARGTTMRKVARPPSLGMLRKLADRQPHMRPVVDFVLNQMMMAERSQSPVRLQPMLLLGEPGIGKTHFAQLLARTLDTTIRVERLDSDITNSFLLGSDRKWGNSRHGALIDILVRGDHANPVIVLDELDKAQRTSYGSSASALYSVLEPLSAKSVRDISLDFEFDASLVTWIATANDARLIDGPLRSRFREFHIMPPTAEEALTLAKCVVEDTIIDSGVSMDFDPRICRYVAHLPARQISQLTLDAVAKAVADGRNKIGPRELPSSLFDEPGEPARHRLH